MNIQPTIYTNHLLIFNIILKLRQFEDDHRCNACNDRKLIVIYVLRNKIFIKIEKLILQYGPELKYKIDMTWHKVIDYKEWGVVSDMSETTG